MKVTLKFFGAMCDIFDGEEKILELSGRADVGQLVAALCNLGVDKDCPEILDEAGNVRPEIRLLVKGQPPRFLKRAADALHDGDVISVFPPMIGG